MEEHDNSIAKDSVNVDETQHSYPELASEVDEAYHGDRYKCVQHPVGCHWCEYGTLFDTACNVCGNLHCNGEFCSNGHPWQLAGVKCDLNISEVHNK